MFLGRRHGNFVMTDDLRESKLSQALFVERLEGRREEVKEIGNG